MERSVLLISLSIGIRSLAFAEAPQTDLRKSDLLIRALELKRSDAVVVLEPEPFVAPRITDRVRVIVNFNDAATPSHSVDVIVLYDTLHALDHRADFYAKLLRVLRLGGRVVNIDLSSKLPESQAVQEFTAAGFHITKTVGFLPNRYFHVFE